MKKVMIAGWETANDKYDDYLEAMERLGAEAFLSVAPEDLAGADLLILPGSSQDMNPKLWGEKDTCSNDINDELDALQRKLLELAVEQGKPALGICRGMQFINVFFGGTLIQDLTCAEEHKARTPEQYHRVLHLPGTFAQELYGDSSEVNTRHHQGIGKIGEGLEVVSVWNDGEDSVVELFAHRRYTMIGAQWHPEKMFLYGDDEQKVDGEKLLRYFLAQ